MFVLGRLEYLAQKKSGLGFSFIEKAEREKLRNDLKGSLKGTGFADPKNQTLPFRKWLKLAVRFSKGCLFLTFHKVKTITKMVKLGVLPDPPCACLAPEHCFSLLAAGMMPLWKSLMETSSKSGDTEVQLQKLRFS